uniref:hypothetical protein n=1 Tax=Bacillus cytotoxicus TaxID=580165 RepID=UPI00203E994E
METIRYLKGKFLFYFKKGPARFYVWPDALAHLKRRGFYDRFSKRIYISESILIFDIQIPAMKKVGTRHCPAPCV